jgi:hypothetical protein
MYYYCDPFSNFPFIDKFFYIFGIVSSALFLSFVTVAYTTKETHKSDSEYETETESESECEVEEKYEDLYPIKDATNTYTDKIETELNIVTENTPDGIVIMKYNFDNESFLYWSYETNISYKYLETVARKFVTMFNCKDCYVEHTKFVKETKTTDQPENASVKMDVEETTQTQVKDKSKPEETSTGEAEEEVAEEKSQSVFANLKSYKKKVEKKDDIQVNSFVRKGSINDFKHSSVEKLEVKAKDVDYRSFASKLSW